jgi:plasmid stability protein
MANVTIKIDDEKLIHAAKIVAARRGTSLSGMVRDYLASVVSHDGAYDRARAKAMRHMKRGLALGGQPLSRDEAHERR